MHDGQFAASLRRRSFMLAACVALAIGGTPLVVRAEAKSIVIGGSVPMAGMDSPPAVPTPALPAA